MVFWSFKLRRSHAYAESIFRATVLELTQVLNARVTQGRDARRCVEGTASCKHGNLHTSSGVFTKARVMKAP